MLMCPFQGSAGRPCRGSSPSRAQGSVVGQRAGALPGGVRPCKGHAGGWRELRGAFTCAPAQPALRASPTAPRPRRRPRSQSPARPGHESDAGCRGAGRAAAPGRAPAPGVSVRRGRCGKDAGGRRKRRGGAKGPASPRPPAPEASPVSTASRSRPGAPRKAFSPGRLGAPRKGFPRAASVHTEGLPPGRLGAPRKAFPRAASVHHGKPSPGPPRCTTERLPPGRLGARGRPSPGPPRCTTERLPPGRLGAPRKAFPRAASVHHGKASPGPPPCVGLQGPGPTFASAPPPQPQQSPAATRTPASSGCPPGGHRLPMAPLTQAHRDWGCLLALLPQTANIARGSLPGASSSPAPKMRTSADSWQPEGASLESCCSASSALGIPFQCPQRLGLPLALAPHRSLVAAGSRRGEG